MVCEFLLYLLVAIPYLKTGNTNLEITTDKAINLVSDKFLSVAIDVAHLRNNLAIINLPKIIFLAKALSPCSVRVGGTQADFMKFSPSTEDHEDSQHDNQYDHFSTDPNKKPLMNMAMSEGQWDQLNIFVSKVGWSLIFDLNSLLRKNGNRSPENARLLLNYSTRRGYKIAGWELGNEPDAYEHSFGYDITASQRADDYLKLHILLNEYFEWRKCVTIGPSTTGRLEMREARNYLKEFLQTGGPDIVTNPSFHHYYVNGRKTSIDQFMDPAILDELPPEIKAAHKIVKHPPYGKVWLGETSSAYGGGAPGLSDRYVAGFM
jgi:heparanase 1